MASENPKVWDNPDAKNIFKKVSNLEKKIRDLEERKSKAEEARINQINEVERTKEIERENLRRREEEIQKQSQGDEKRDP